MIYDYFVPYHILVAKLKRKKSHIFLFYSDDGLSLTSTEQLLLDKMKSSNNPWTIRQLKVGGSHQASHSLCASLVEKGFIIKVCATGFCFFMKP